MKKVLSVLLSLFLILECVPVLAESSIADSAIFTVASVEAHAGETVAIAVAVEKNPGFSYLKLSWSYDADTLEFVKAENGTVSTDSFSPTEKYLSWDTENNTNVTGTLCTFTFKVKENASTGEYPVSVKIEKCFDESEATVSFTVNPGKVTVEAPAHVHDFSVLKSDDTHHWFECANGCDEISGKAAHTYGEWTVTKEPTETAEGEKTHECSVCKYKQTESIPKLIPAKEAILSVASVEAHAGETVAIAVTVEKNPGFSYLKLSWSYDADTLEFVKAENGTVSTDSFSPTEKYLSWDTENNTNVTGTLCTFTFKVKENASAGEYPVSVKIEKCFDESEATVSFTVNPGKVTVEAPSHVHDFSVLKSDDTYHWYECANGCDEISGKAAHTYGEWTVTKEPTETAEGEKSRNCTVCGYTQTEIIPVVAPPQENFGFWAGVADYDGETLELSLLLNDCRGLADADIVMFYDSGALSVQPNTAGEWQGEPGEGIAYLNGCTVMDNTDIPGRINTNLFLTEALDNTGAYELARYSFNVSADAPETTEIILVVKQFTSFGEYVPSQVKTVLNTKTGEWTVSSVSPMLRPGDVDRDGKITAADARLALRRAVKLESFAPGSIEYYLCNVDADLVEGSEEVTSSDARLILRAAVQLEDLPETYMFGYLTPADLSFDLLGHTYTYPYVLKDFLDNGWQMDLSIADEVLQPNAGFCFTMTQGDEEIFLTVDNNTKEPCRVMDGNISQIELTLTGKSKFRDARGLTAESGCDEYEIVRAYGTPHYTVREDGDTVLYYTGSAIRYYEDGSYSTGEGFFCNIDFILTGDIFKVRYALPEAWN